ncbi:uncharacterized protein LOC144580528 isoform X2 [Callithrix jacchus]
MSLRVRRHRPTISIVGQVGTRQRKAAAELQDCPGRSPTIPTMLQIYPVSKEQWSACGNSNIYTKAVLRLVEISNILTANTQQLYGRKEFLEREDKDGLCCRRSPKLKTGELNVQPAR